MKRTISGICLILLACAGVRAQSFEVASIKPAPPPAAGGGMRVGQSGGPGTKDPGRFTTENFSLSNLITMAYDLKLYQLTGPSWLGGERFNIVAKVPEGATKEQFKAMLQNLLTERFKLTFHREKKEMPIYELVVAKDGPKFKAADPELEAKAAAAAASGAPPPPPLFDGQGPRMDAQGFPAMPAGRGGMIMMNGRARSQSPNQTMEGLAAQLSGQVQRPVTDATGLKGKYDISLYWSTSSGMAGPAGMPPPPPPPGAGVGGEVRIPDGDSGPTIFSAIQQQLGLKLESRKGMIDVLIVDRIEKVPTEN